jgi:16S rRNA (adenine1518-N6/adenine1519-N6)-dimethyltransferase
MTTVRPRKGLGQHFLHDPAVIARIVDEIHPEPDDAVVEIGGGQGALTRPLLARLNHLDVIEADRRLVPVLQSLAPEDRLTVHAADALAFDLASLGAEPGTLRIVGNLPYNISTPLIFRFLKYRHLIRDLHVMLQKEVADRIAAGPGSKTYGRLTVMLAAWTDIEPCFDIGPGAFNPAPRVRSTVIRIRPRTEPKFPIADERAWEQLVALAFTMRRKTMRRILKGILTEDEIRDIDLDPGARPETLLPADFARLSDLTAGRLSR